jgi:hypothetical protein
MTFYRVYVLVYLDGRQAWLPMSDQFEIWHQANAWAQRLNRRYTIDEEDED